MNSTDKEVRWLRRQIRRARRGSGVMKWDAVGEELIRAVGQFTDAHGEIARRDLAKRLGVLYHQLDYVLSKYRKLPKKKPVRTKPKLAPVQIVDEGAPVANRGGPRGPGPVEFVLESGIRVSVSSTDQVLDLLESLERRGRRVGA